MRRNPLEWAILLVSIGAVLAIVAILLADIVAGPPAAPRIAVTVDAESGTDGPAGWTAPLVVRNEGGTGVRALVVECTAAVDDREEVSSLTIDLLGPSSEMELAVGWSAAPDGEVACRVVGFEVP